MIEEALVYLLKSNSTIKAMVGERIGPKPAPQDWDFPRIVYQLVTGERERSLTGPSGLAHPRIQIEAVALTYAETKTLAQAIRVLLDGYGGRVPAEGGRLIHDIELQGEHDDPENPKDSGDRPVRRVILDFEVWHEE